MHDIYMRIDYRMSVIKQASSTCEVAHMHLSRARSNGEEKGRDDTI